MTTIKQFICAALFSIAVILQAASVQAQDRFILLIDGSGSMWGKVEGEYKITVLRDAIDDVLTRLDTTADVGVVAFGHREKGNCADIEEIVPPGPLDVGAIGAAIRGINPKGKTPLSESVRFAAESLRFTEERATVVILGDGRESCEMDPCAVAEELEHLGVDFTVHAVAFDIADEEGTRQLQCFARATGGLFLPADNAAELISALEEVRVEVAPEPGPVQITFTVNDPATGGIVNAPVEWTVSPASGGAPIRFSSAAGQAGQALAPGDYDAVAVVTLPDAGQLSSQPVRFSLEPETPIVVELAIARPDPAQIRLVAQDAETGAPIPGALEWTFINSATEELYEFTAASGSTQDALPPGDYEVFVQVGDAFGEAVIRIDGGAREDVVVQVVTTTAPGLIVGGESVPGGSGVDVRWDFAGLADDIVFIAPVAQGENTYPLDDARRHVVGASNSTRLVAPAQPGTYEIRYFSFAAGGLVHRAPITVTPPEVTLSGPAAIEAGERVSITWTGPGEDGDFVFIAPADWAPNSYPLDQRQMAGVAGGSPLVLPAPEREGAYEYRYFSRGAGQALKSVPVAVALATASITAPETVAAGSVFEVEFRGPRVAGDRLFVAEPTMDANRYLLGPEAENAVSNGSPARLVAPAVPGSYDIRYFSVNKGGLLAQGRISVAPAEVTLDAPRIVNRASSFRLRADGPEAPGDMIFIADATWKDNQYPLSAGDQFIPGADGNGFFDDDGLYAFDAVAPPKPGRYEIRYYSRANAGVLARRLLVVK